LYELITTVVIETELEVEMSDTRKSSLDWMVDTVFWALVIFLAVMAVGLFATKDMVGGIGFTIFAVCVLSAVHPFRWLQRFSQN